MNFTDALLNSEAFSLIRNDVKRGALSHAYMVISPDAEAVKELFLLVGCAVYCPYDVCLECTQCKKVMHNNHADITHLNLDGGKISVDDVKGLIDDTFLAPYESDRKLYFVYNAEQMNAAAQNKLLKTFEEPAASSTIFLGTAGEQAMLETLKSRAKKIYLDRFSPQVIKKQVESITGDSSAAEVASVCADGLLSRALEIAQNGAYAETFDATLDLLDNLQKSRDIVLYLDDKLPFVKNMPLFLDILSVIMRDVMVAGAQNERFVLSRHRLNRIENIASRYSARAAGEIIYLINDARKKTAVNVGAAGVLENLLFGILEVNYRCRK